MRLPESYRHILDTTVAERRYWFPPQEDDLAWLLWFLDEAKPKRILEFGSGFSSLVIWQWVATNGASSESLEENPVFFRCGLAEKRLDIVQQRLLFSPVQTSAPNFDRIRYSYRLMRFPDFIYADGPHLYFGEIELDMELCGIAPVTILFDGREEALRRMRTGQRFEQWGSCHDGDRGILTNCRSNIIETYKRVKAAES